MYVNARSATTDIDNYNINGPWAYNHGLGAFLRFWGVFQFKQIQPLPSPHKQYWTRQERMILSWRVYPELFPSFNFGWGEGELQENFEKDALFSEGTEKWQKNMNIVALSLGLLSRIVDGVFFRNSLNKNYF